MTRSAVRAGSIAIALALAWAGPAGAQPNPEQYYNSLVGNPNLNQEAGELWAWHANWGMGQFVQGYHAYNDTSWLDWGVQYYDFVLDHMRQAPDGYMGWIGPLPIIGSRTDEHIGDAILFKHMLEFADLVKRDPALASQYGQKADHYVELAQTHLIEKWDARGTYHRADQVGFYRWWDQQLPEDLSEWQHDPSRVSGFGSVTQQFNKQIAMGLNAVRLYRITGEQKYQDRAFELFGFLKSRMHHYNDTYVWNFREPALREDVISVANNNIRTWVAVHPTNAGYQAGAIGRIVEAYHSGIVFDETDIQRLINTQLQVMWNGSLSNPSFTGPDAWIRGGSTNTAGTFWSGLADFDATIRELRGGPGSNMRSRIMYDYFVNVTLAQEPSFDRKFVDNDEDVRVLDWPHGDTRSIMMAFLTDPVFEPGVEDTIIGSKVINPSAGSLRISLYDAAGEQELLIIEDGPSVPSWGDYVTMWDGTDGSGQPLAPGDYRIRWTWSIDSFGDDGYREYPITLVPEPTTLTLLSLGALALLRRRR